MRGEQHRTTLVDAPQEFLRAGLDSREAGQIQLEEMCLMTSDTVEFLDSSSRFLLTP
jgi:hypothetical protein